MGDDPVTPIKGSHQFGAFVVSWVISGTGYATAFVTLTLNNEPAGESPQLNANFENWQQGKKAVGDYTLDEISIDFTPPVGDQILGSLVLANTGYQEKGQQPVPIAGQQLVQWNGSGTVTSS